MRSMRMAALAVAMTLLFSGLALARDHDDKDRHDHWDKHADRDRHHDRDHDRDHDRWRDRNNERERERVQREHHWWERDHRRDDGYYGGGQIYNRYPRGNPGGYGILAVDTLVVATPTADMATPAASMAAPAAAGMPATTSAFRMGPTWRART